MTPARRALAALAALALAPAAALAAFLLLAPPGPDRAAGAERSAVVLDREGRLLRAFTTPGGRWRLPLAPAEVDARYLALLVAYEDARHAAHPGVDPLALARAAAQLARNGRVVSGASTLTMQVARLLGGEGARAPRGRLKAKLVQAAHALRLARAATKDEVLALYLALAPFGGNLEGVRAASLAYLGKEPRRLTLAEAALLVALPQSPEARRPDRHPETARRARDRALDRALRAGLAAPAEVEAARAEPVPRARRPLPVLAPHAAEAALAERPHERVHRLSIDAGLQAALEALAAERAPALGPRLSVAVVAIDNASGALLASVGGPAHLDPERAGALDLARALRSPGSALKPFVYALAFDNGLAHPGTLLEDRPQRFGLYAPENFDLGFQGQVTARAALAASLNLPAVDLLSALGPGRFVASLRGAGARLALPTEEAPGLAVALGGLGTTLTDLARLTAALPRGGTVPAPLTRDGEAPGPARRLVGPLAAWQVAQALRDAPAPPGWPPGRLAFKTGTSYGHRDAWAAGFDRRRTIAVWVGRPDGAPVPGLTGRTAAAPLLFDAFARAGLDPAPLAPPPEAAGAALAPPPLRRLRADARVPGAANPPRVAFPPDGASLELAGEGDATALKVQGGVAPFTWLVDGRPIAPPDPRRAADWRPEGRGFARIAVVDARGETDSVRVRLR